MHFSIYIFFYAFFCPGTITTHAESTNSALQRGLDRRLPHNIEQFNCDPILVESWGCQPQTHPVS